MSNPELGVSDPKVDYALGHSSRELDRLSFQGTVFAPYTRQFLTEAGLRAGMRVLDVGSGSGAKDAHIPWSPGKKAVLCTNYWPRRCVAWRRHWKKRILRPLLK